MCSFEQYKNKIMFDKKIMKRTSIAYDGCRKIHGHDRRTNKKRLKKVDQRCGERKNDRFLTDDGIIEEL